MISDSPIIQITGFKSGTWLLRAVMDRLLGCSWYEPEFKPGRHKYSDMANVVFKDYGYYSWHLNPVPEIRRYILSQNAKVVVLLRNLYEVSVSAFHHLYYDIDAGIGRSAGKKDFLQKYDRKDAQTLVITGFDEQGYFWGGIKEIVEQYCNCIYFAIEAPGSVHILDYRGLVCDKENSIRRLANYLQIDINEHMVKSIISETDFLQMKRNSQNNSSLHFRQGTAGRAYSELLPVHIALIDSIIKGNVSSEVIKFCIERNMDIMGYNVS